MKTTNNKNHFYISYCGNKRNEINEILQYLNVENKNQVIEPYCGSCAISYHIWLKYPHLKFILNDNEKFLKEMYEIIIDDNKLNEFENQINNVIIPLISPCDLEGKLNYLEILKNENVISWFIKHKYYQIRPGLYPLNNKSKILPINIRQTGIYNFFRNAKIEMTINDGLDTYKLYKDDEKNIIIFDPPYLSKYNGFYGNPTLQLYEYLADNNFNNEKAFIMLILEKCFFNRLLFENNIKSEYNKMYQNQIKTKTKHYIITNKN